MWITFVLLTLCFSLTQTTNISCKMVIDECQKTDLFSWTRCYERNITTCRRPRLTFLSDIQFKSVNSSQKANITVKQKYTVRFPPSALRRSRHQDSEEEVLLVASVINSTYFKPQTPKSKLRISRRGPPPLQGEVLEREVLFVKAGSKPVTNLTQLIELRFKHSKTAINATCVFWEEDLHKSGWSTSGCQTRNNGQEVICSCNHLSFFAVLVNPNLKVDESNEERLSYITYVGSGLSALFSFISLFIYIGLHRRRPEKAISMHMQLTVAVFCLHLGFLACSLWVLLPSGNGNTWVCRGLGLFLHWSLVATFTWVALEGFHLYLLLVRVFNIYVRRYVLKLSIVGWGLPTLVSMICGISGAYGKYILELKNSKNHTSTSEICWLRSDFSQRELVLYITLGFLCLVVLYNACMLGLVVFKLWGLRGDRGGYESSSDWKKMKKEKGPRLWKDCTTVLGLSCVLGIPWGLATATYVTLPGIYLFTILNSLQGLFLFLWSVALSCKSRAEQNASVKDHSSQKMTTTSF